MIKKVLSVNYALALSEALKSLPEPQPFTREDWKDLKKRKKLSRELTRRQKRLDKMKDKELK